MELREMIKVMQHYADGGEVEVRYKNDDDDIWENTTNASWNWSMYDYRIKEQRQRVTIEKWLVQYEENYFVIDVSDIENCPNVNKVKLLEKYEVEL